MNTAVIGIGSNIQPTTFIPQAINILGQHLSIKQKSDFIRTAPVGLQNQPDFINGAILVETDHSLEQLKDLLVQTEDRLGRTRTKNKFGPRNIDLDILVFNGCITNPDVTERIFLQKNIKQLLPDFSFPSS